jgi:sulfur carrier protein ThiS
VLDIVHKLDFLPEEVIVIRRDELLTRNEIVEDSDEIEVRPSVSGG